MRLFEKDMVKKVSSEWRTALELGANELQLMRGARKGWIFMCEELVPLKNGVFQRVRKFKLKEKS